MSPSMAPPPLGLPQQRASQSLPAEGGGMDTLLVVDFTLAVDVSSIGVSVKWSDETVAVDLLGFESVVLPGF